MDLNEAPFGGPRAGKHTHRRVGGGVGLAGGWGGGRRGGGEGGLDKEGGPHPVRR